MKIDERIEAQVREALAAVVGKEGKRFDDALDAMGSDGPTAWSYAAYVVGYVINDIEGVNDQTLDVIAGQAIEAVSAFADLGSKDEVKALLKSASEGNSKMPGVPVEKVVNSTFVLASYLLQAYKPDDHDHWWNYLDEIWNAAAAAS